MKTLARNAAAVVAAMAAVVVLAPVAVEAATGSLTNIVDAVDASRKGRVGDIGTVYTESRAGVVRNAFNVRAFANTTGFFPLFEADYPYQLAVTEVQMSTLGGTSGSWDLALVAYRRVSGTAACGGIGWTKVTVRDITHPWNAGTAQLLFNGPPLVLPRIETGQRVCYGLEVWGTPSSAVLRFASVGYKYKV